MPRRGRDAMVMRKLKIKKVLKNTFYRKSNGNLISQLKILIICLGYQNIPVNLDEALRQIGRYLYGVQHHERAQRVTHSLEALDEGSGTEMRAEGHRRHF